MQHVEPYDIALPGDTVTKVQQISSQSDLISMSNFDGPSYLFIRFFIYITLIWDPCIFNLHSFCQTIPNCMRSKNLTNVHFISGNK